MENRFYVLIYICSLMILGQASAGTAEMTGGWNVAGNGQQSDSGVSHLAFSGSDPSITLGISADSSLFGPGSDSRTWAGSQNIDINIAGFRLTAGYDGKVDSNVILTSVGSASSAAFVGASASGLATGHVPTGTGTGGDSYDMFGSSDITTEGFVSGQGTAAASASGSANYDVQKSGVSSEVWGNVAGSSSMSLESDSTQGIVSTGGTKNGLHAESRVTRTLQEDISASASSQLTSYASIVNKGSANVLTSGSVLSGSWDPTFVGTKVRSDQAAGNENVATSATGTLGTLDQMVETNGDSDAADVSSILQSTASKELTASGALTLTASGGPATYATTSQSTSSGQTFAQTWVRDALWGSVAKTQSNQMAIEWGQADDLGAGAICDEPSNALSFGKILMSTEYALINGISTATGNLEITTYAEAVKGTNAFGGAIISGNGTGDMKAFDSSMTNEAGFEGGMDHLSFVDAGRVTDTGKGFAETRNIAKKVFAGADPGGSYVVIKPFQENTSTDPIFAWSSSEGSYSQTHK